ncbi:FadR/GntR family transcriptional regulator [Brachybacterium sp. ACRRE]|uniref:FadR/GntR family transcriptional regulator n=1 Tax=Brachybacterium sp. ACRRE TaxID=2918184 RepID=UPI001EF37794|nr:GntR family transcriptional regulator [Brachybacterium sp. ACRRE]MCG7309527.1 GntR family transcriptional regulator [Brachybacterium sp. ACRRE]
MTPRLSLSEQLAQEIVDRIRSERLGPGDVMPATRRLAESLEVTVPTLREALRRLEASKVVELRHGSGVYVGTGIERALIVNPHRPPITRESVRELAAARLAIEPGIAAEAARARSPQTLDALERAAQNALHDPDPAGRPEQHFHVALAGCTGNALLVQTIDALLERRSQEQVEIRFSYDDRARDHAEHLEILRAVREGDAHAAASLTSDHLEHIRDAIDATAHLEEQS